MIKQLKDKDFDAILAYLETDHINNVYPIHALQTYGLESQKACFWGAFFNDRMVGALYFEKVGNVRLGSVCGDSSRILGQWGKHVIQNGIHVLVGKKDYIRFIIEEHPDRFVIEGRYDFIQMFRGQYTGHYDYPVQTASEAHISALVDLYKTSELGETRLKERKEIESEIRRTLTYESGYFFVEQDGRIVSAAKIIAETDQYGIIDGATTLPECRGQGIYPSVRTVCLEYLFQKGKIGLTYISEDNTAMKKIVKKTSGSHVGKWMIVNAKKKLALKEKIKKKLHRIKKRILT